MKSWELEGMIAAELGEMRAAEMRLARRFRNLGQEEDCSSFLNMLEALQKRAARLERLVERLDGSPAGSDLAMA